MSGIIGLSYSNKENCEEFVHDLFWEVHFLQHLKMGYGGLATLKKDGKSIVLRTHRGVFKETFREDLKGFYAPLGIGSTTSLTREPYLVEKSSFPEFALSFSGKITNFDQLIKELVTQGHCFEKQEEVILMSKLISLAGFDDNKSLSENFFQALSSVAEKVQGSFVLVILTAFGVYAFRSPDGHHQLSIGTKEGAVIIASELPQIDNQGFKLESELKSGELVCLNKGTYQSVGRIQLKENAMAKPCIFSSVYYGNPPSINFGITNTEFRQKLGAALATKDIDNGFIPDRIIPVPDSGRFHALGYYHEYLRQYLAGNIDKLPVYVELLIKYGLATRSFTPEKQKDRKIEGEKKIIPAIEINPEIKNQRSQQILVAIDDSLVRGTQMKSKLVPKINQLGFKEVHVRFGYPKILSPCNWAQATKKGDELAAIDEHGDNRTDKQIAKMIGVDSCGFNFVSDLEKAARVSSDQFCCDCAKK
jgi:glutamine phosphoribosylpyrophosphate amidotransferase